MTINMINKSHGTARKGVCSHSDCFWGSTVEELFRTIPRPKSDGKETLRRKTDERNAMAHSSRFTPEQSVKRKKMAKLLVGSFSVEEPASQNVFTKTCYTNRIVASIFIINISSSIISINIILDNTTFMIISITLTATIMIISIFSTICDNITILDIITIMTTIVIFYGHHDYQHQL